MTTTKYHVLPRETRDRDDERGRMDELAQLLPTRASRLERRREAGLAKEWERLRTKDWEHDGHLVARAQIAEERGFAIEVVDYGVERYVHRVTCTRCGHQLKFNQGVWQLRHSHKHTGTWS